MAPASGLEPEVGVSVTPVHPSDPHVDEAGLGALSERFRRYCPEHADRMETFGQAEGPTASRDFPEDRMYMDVPSSPSGPAARVSEPL